MSAITEITVTRQVFDGWIGGTSTESVTISGCTTETALVGAVSIYGVTHAVTGEIAFTNYSTFNSYSFLTETILGINSLGASAEYTVATPVYSLVLRSWVNYSGAPGYTYTTKRSPLGNVSENGAGVQISRLERAGGYQSPHALGSTGAQGASISAASTFYIGSNNIGVGSPVDLLTPFLTSASTAETNNSKYSFSFGSTNCSVTALKTDSSSSTLTTFTASIFATSAADTFTINDQIYDEIPPISSYPYIPSVVGGAHAWTGGRQDATIYGHGVRYTIGDSLGTTSYRETITGEGSTKSLGSSVLALEGFLMAHPSPILQPGLPYVEVFPYSAP
jgi:hypothetical protein